MLEGMVRVLELKKLLEKIKKLKIIFFSKKSSFDSFKFLAISGIEPKALNIF